MKFLSLAVVAAAEPIKDVMQQMSKMYDESVSLYKEDGFNYKKQARHCKNSIPKDEDELATTTDNLEEEIANFKQYSASVGALSAEIKELEETITSLENKQQEDEDAEKKRVDIKLAADTADKETQAAMKKAIDTLVGAECSANFLLVQQAVLLNSVNVSDEDLAEVQSFVQDMAAPAPAPALKAIVSPKAAACNSNRLKKILQLLKNIFQKHDDEKKERELADVRAMNAAAAAAASLVNELDETKAAKDQKESRMDEDQKKALKAETAKEDLKSKKADEEKALSELKKDCQDWSMGFEERSEKFLGEQKAIKKAISVLAQVTGMTPPLVGGKPVNSSFFQKIVRSLSPRAKALNLIRAAAAESRSKDLEAFANRVAASPFKTINEEIQKFLFAIKKAQTEDDNRNEWCKGELEKTSSKIMRDEEKESDLAGKIDTADANLSKLQEDIKAATELVKTTEEEMLSLKDDRREARMLSDKILREQKIAVEAVQKAVGIMQDFYDKHGGRPTIGTGKVFLQVASGDDEEPAVVQLLKTLEGKYTMSIAEVTSQEERDVIEFDKITGEKQTVVTGAKTEIDNKTARSEQVKGNLAELRSKKQAVQKSLFDYRTYEKSDLHPACIADPTKGQQTYEERTKARDAEIKGLKDAAKTLKEAFDDK